MKLTKKQENEIWQVYDTWLDSYLNGDVATYDKYLDKDYHFIGSTDNEEFLSKKDTTNFFKKTADQFAGKTQLRNETKIIEKFEELVFITHLFDAWFLNRTEWNYYGRFRFSNALKKNKEGWRFIYQHFSTTDNKADDGETIGFDKVNAENQELREAIKRRTFELEAKNRELEIEGALERIRAQAVAMQQSSDLLDIVVTMRNEFTKLGHEAHYFWHMMWLPEKYEKAMTSGDGTKIGFVMELPRHIHGDIPLLADWEKSDDEIVIYPMNAKAAINYVDKMVNLGDFQNIDPQAPSHDDIRHIGGLTFIMARTTHGEIGFSLPGVVKNPPAEDLDILVQFAGAFDLAHRRFLDLQKAEKQAREVQIELALEKVRSRTMAMQHSDELQETSFLLDEQVRALGIKTWGCAFNIYGEHDSTEWFGNQAGVLHTYTVPREGIFKDYYQKGQNGESLLIKEFSGDDCIAHYDYMSTLPVIGDVLKTLKETNDGFPTYQIDHVVYFKYGYLLFITREPVPDAHAIFKRFAKVFEQTYTRFLDLQKAEAQAREAQIELGLERVRARAMAMQHSDELSDLVATVLNELTKLDFALTWCIINIINEADQSNMVWATNPEGGTVPESYYMKFEDYPFHHAMMRAWKAQKSKFVYTIEGKEKKIYDDYLYNETEFKRFSNKVKKANRALDRYVASFTFSNFGGLQTVSSEPLSDENLDILERFGKVFDLTFTRFNDLQKAEAQGREAQIEAALERVRSQSMGMQTSKDLSKVTTEMFNQMRQFGGDLYATGIVFCDKHKGHVEQWHSIPNAGMMSPFIVPIDLDYIHQYRYDQWKKGTELFSIEIPSDFIDQHFNDIFKLPSAQVVLKEFEANKTPMPPTPDWEIDYGASFKHGYVLVSSLQPFKEAEILPRFAKVFEQTYTRFLDLQKAEAQAREAQIETALERVRSRSMAMHKSEELQEVVKVIFDQMAHLNINADHAGIVVDYEPKKDFHFWVADNQDIPARITVPYLDLVWDRQFTEAKKKGTDFFTTQLDFEEKNSFYKKLLPHIEGLTKQAWDFYLNCPGLTASTVIQKDTGLYIENFSGIPFSEEDNNILMRFGKVFQQTYTRFLDLQKAEAQAREVQIEHALEKVRSRTMAMQNSSELPEAANNLFLQVQELGIPAWSAGYCIWEDDQKSATAFMSSEGVIQKPFVLPTIGVGYNFAKPLKKGDLFHVEELGGKLIKKHYEFMRTLPIFGEVIDGILEAGHPLPTFQIFHICYFKYGYVMFITYETVPKAHGIFKRFAKVFEQTYTRFLDLQKAEAQTREAQIEAALERTRTQSMLMQHSDELSTTTQVFHEQLQLLGIDSEFSYLWLPDETEKNHLFWATWSELNKRKTIYKNKAVTFPLDKSEPSIEACYVAWESEETVHVNTVKSDEVEDYFNTWSELLNGVDKFKPELFPDGLYYIDAYMDYGCFGIMIKRQLVDDEKNILSRFSKEFQRTYTRFLDLQKAEAQAREAQIEAALEKVRSRSLAMHKPAELQEVVAVVAEKLQELGVIFDAGGVILCTYFPDNKDVVHWIAVNDFSSSGRYYLPYFDNPIFNEAWDSKIKGDAYFSKEFPVEAKNEFFKHAFDNSDYRHFPDDYKQHVLAADQHNLSAAWSKNSAIIIPSLTGAIPSEGDAEIMKRFAKVFEQAYIRFLDLQKSEAQAREAQITASLEKVRASTMAMHNSEELSDVLSVLFEQFDILNINPSHAVLTLINPEKNTLNFRMTGQHGYKVLAEQEVDLNLVDTWIDTTEKWKKSEPNAVNVNEYPTEVLPDVWEVYKEILASIPKKARPEIKDFPDGLFITEGYCRFGYIGFAHHRKPTEEEKDIVKRFAAEFGTLYQRFLDLQKAEAQAREAQIETALEKVRSRTMAMQHSDELPEAANVLFLEIQSLGIPAWSCGYNILAGDNKSATCWMSSEGALQEPFVLRLWGETSFEEMEAFIRSTDTLLVQELGGKAIEAHYDHMKSFPDLLPIFEHLQAEGLSLPTYQINHLCKFSQGFLLFITYEKIPDAHDIFKRFTSVFEQTYTRFLDLQLKEQQAEELVHEKQRLEGTLKNLRATQAQLVHAEKMASLGDLTAGIAHEIQNPLNFVNNFSEVSSELIEEMNEEIVKGDLEEAKVIANDVKQNLEKILHHGKRADEIVKGMLQHSRSSSGVKEPTDINALADEYLRLAYHGLRAKDNSFNATMKTEFDETIDNINIIPQDIGRVMLNLITNAFYACTERSRSATNEKSSSAILSKEASAKLGASGDTKYEPTISISTKKEGDKVFVSVTDNGNGIPKKVLDKIFQPFFTTKPTGQGTGLGLSLSYDIIKAHKGEISVKSKVGEGTTFTIALPA